MAEVGEPAPDFALTDHNRNVVTLSKYKGQKNVVLSWHATSFGGG